LFVEELVCCPGIGYAPGLEVKGLLVVVVQEWEDEDD
jgi:hypothetical protein